MGLPSLSMNPVAVLVVVTSASVVFGGCANRTPVARVGAKVVNAASDARATDGVLGAHNAFYAASNLMFAGDAEPMSAVWSHDDDVTDLSPFGDRRLGWKEVRAEFKREAAMKLGGSVVSVDVVVGFSDDMAYTIGVEHAKRMTVDGKPVEVQLRATNIFRLQGGKWKLVHHHADLSAPLEAAVSSK